MLHIDTVGLFIRHTRALAAGGWATGAPDSDWRARVDNVTNDLAYDRQVFNVALADVPERKDELVGGIYELAAPDGPTTLAVKITDMLGEEVLSTVEV